MNKTLLNNIHVYNNKCSQATEKCLLSPECDINHELQPDTVNFLTFYSKICLENRMLIYCSVEKYSVSGGKNLEVRIHYELVILLKVVKCGKVPLLYLLNLNFVALCEIGSMLRRLKIY